MCVCVSAACSKCAASNIIPACDTGRQIFQDFDALTQASTTEMDDLGFDDEASPTSLEELRQACLVRGTKAPPPTGGCALATNGAHCPCCPTRRLVRLLMHCQLTHASSCWQCSAESNLLPMMQCLDLAPRLVLCKSSSSCTVGVALTTILHVHAPVTGLHVGEC